MIAYARAMQHKFELGSAIARLRESIFALQQSTDHLKYITQLNLDPECRAFADSERVVLHNERRIRDERERLLEHERFYANM